VFRDNPLTTIPAVTTSKGMLLSPTRPFLRWAGGKSWLLNHLRSLIPQEGFRAYHEPFLGGGAVFFDIAPTGRTFLSDTNGELVETYCQVRDSVESVIDHLRQHVNSAEYYYDLRASVPNTPSERAARFIYLNQTSFNGIYRVNQKGEYNVPFGYRSKRVLDEPNLRSVSDRLQGTWISTADFDSVRSRVTAGDFVFLDPPYTVSHNDNGFLRYNQKLFSFEDQKRLRDLVRHLDDCGAHYVLTNAAHDSIAELFDVGNRRLELERISRVGGRHAPRGTFSEYVFTNVGIE